MLKIAWSDIYCHPLPENHRFPMIKYELLPQQLIREGTIEKSNLFQPVNAADQDILAVHDGEYWSKLRELSLSNTEIRKAGFPLSKGLVDREINIVGGTIQCTHYALEYGIAMNIAGGTHHAYRDRGEGFCLLNDQAIATQYVIDRGYAKRVLIVDLDVHQGNGTAQIFYDKNNVFTFSMHGEKNYPMYKEHSDLDIGLADDCDDEFYLSTLKLNLINVLENFKPDFVFYQSGVDVLASDKLGRLGLSLKGCKARDQFVLETLYARKLPVVVCMGGGYSEDINVIVEAHANTYRLVQDIWHNLL